MVLKGRGSMRLRLEFALLLALWLLGLGLFLANLF